MRRLSWIAIAVSGAALLILASALGGRATGGEIVAIERARSARPHTEIGLGEPKTTRRQHPRQLPIVKQALRSNCETAALSMLIAWDGARVGQLVLQRQLVRSGPLDPVPASAGGFPVWGDPDKGYVGRAEGGGRAGGFGVYQGPVRGLAARHGVRLVDLSRQPLSAISNRLARGVPVMAWIGLSEGPYRRWQTPNGKRIVANFGEHTVVLTGMRDGLVLVNDPLDGVQKTWTLARFEQLWRLLGRRALSY